MPKGVAEEVNSLVLWSQDYVRKGLLSQVKYLMSSGYPPLAEPPRNPEERLAKLEPHVWEALQTALDETQLPGIRHQARETFNEYVQLSQIVGQRNAERTAPA